MDLQGSLTGSRLLSSLARPDIIEYSSEYIQQSLFVVYDVDQNADIPALLVQLWKFDGDYDHGVYNIVVSDLAINTSVSVFTPIKHTVKIENIFSFRGERDDLSSKEQFIMNISPLGTSDVKDASYPIPYQCIVKINGNELHLVLPQWTPIQRLPLEQISTDTYIEVWECKDQFCVMSVIKL